MNNEDKHKTQKLSNFIAVGVSVFFVVIAIAGYQATDDLRVLILFLVLAGVGFTIVKFLFLGINKLLDSIDQNPK
ncbi:MAG: hypothetical protein ACPGPF_06885 [Pontibacterium sp.]